MYLNENRKEIKNWPRFQPIRFILSSIIIIVDLNYEIDCTYIYNLYRYSILFLN